jgi:hypothetical protein
MGTYQSMFVEVPFADDKCDYYWETFNTKENLNNTAEKIASWREEEDALNQRMNIVGQNGNTGEHYEQH